MKVKMILSVFCASLVIGQSVLAAEHPEGSIQFVNASTKKVTAEVTSVGKFNLAANEQKNIPYSSLSQICSSNLEKCTARFYVDNAPAGSATINVLTGKLIKMKLSMKVHTAKVKQVLRAVVIK